MPKNYHLHVMIETKLYEKLNLMAKELGITLAQLCRNKLTENDQLNRIEWMLKKVVS